LLIDFWLSARFGTHDLIPDLKDLTTLGKEMVAKAPAGTPPPDEPSLGHLWFLYYLCYFYLLIPVCRFLARQSLRIEDRLRRWLASPFLLPVFALFTSASLWPYHGGQVHEGFIFLKPHVPSLVYYGSFFVFGYLFHAHRDFLQSLARNVSMWAVLAAILFPLAMYASQLDNDVRGASTALHLGAVIANGLCTWALIYFFLGLAQRFFDRESPWIQYVSQSSYWVYLVHMPLVCLAGWWLVQFDLPAMLKFLLVCVFTAALAFLSFQYWVQRTWLGVFLHGRRLALDWPWRGPALAQSRQA